MTADLRGRQEWRRSSTAMHSRRYAPTAPANANPDAEWPDGNDVVSGIGTRRCPGTPAASRSGRARLVANFIGRFTTAQVTPTATTPVTAPGWDRWRQQPLRLLAKAPGGRQGDRPGRRRRCGLPARKVVTFGPSGVVGPLARCSSRLLSRCSGFREFAVMEVTNKTTDDGGHRVSIEFGSQGSVRHPPNPRGGRRDPVRAPLQAG
jgi:hypothetical protein